MTKRIALITGGARGIGRAIALDLATHGWSIAICYRTSLADAEATKAGIIERGGQALSLQCDVSDPNAAQQLVAHVEQLWGGIDVLINGAGPYHRVNLFDETIAGWREMFDGNLHPIFYLAQMVAPGMKEAHIRAHREFQHGECRPDGVAARCDRALHCKSRRPDSHAHPGEAPSPLWDHRQCDFSRLHRFRQRTTGRTGGSRQTYSGRVYRNRRGHGRGGPLSSFG